MMINYDLLSWDCPEALTIPQIREQVIFWYVDAGLDTSQELMNVYLKDRILK